VFAIETQYQPYIGKLDFATAASITA